MNKGLVAYRYALAFLEYVQEKGMAKEAYDKSRLITGIFSEVNKLNEVLANPMVSKDKKRELILTASGGEWSEIFENVVGLLLRNNREDHLYSIMLTFQELYCRSLNVYRGKLTTAVEIDDVTVKTLKNSIESTLNGKLELNSIIDPKILGGFILEVDYKRWDASLRGQLNRIKKQYIERNRRIV